MDIYNRMHKKDPKFELVPNSDNKDAWQAMDKYFNALLDLASEEEPSPQILTPPMSQGNFGEHLINGTCQTNFVHDESNPNSKKSGYDWMVKMYSSVNIAGYSWHNYWKWQHEAWDKVGFVEWKCDTENYTPSHIMWCSTSQFGYK